VRQRGGRGGCPKGNDLRFEFQHLERARPICRNGGILKRVVCAVELRCDARDGLLRRGAFVGGFHGPWPGWGCVGGGPSRAAVLAPNARTGSWLQRPWSPWDLAFFRAVFSSHPPVPPSRHLHFALVQVVSTFKRHSISPVSSLHSPFSTHRHSLQIPASLPLSYPRSFANHNPIHHQFDIGCAPIHCAAAVIDATTSLGLLPSLDLHHPRPP
jgi:hypothetical protein